MFKKSIRILLVFIVHTSLCGQQLLKNNDKAISSQIGQEGIFIHYNTPLLFGGEYFYYSVYCINKKTGTLSEASKIAYVELVGETANTLFKHKISLQNGLGQGDFFVPASVPSGNYKLIGYTQWMRNWDDQSFFMADISILNPYTNAQKVFLSDQSDHSSTVHHKDTTRQGINSLSSFYKENKIDMVLDAQEFSKRQRVAVKLVGKEKDSFFGNYSISVRKIDTIRVPSRSNTYDFKNKFTEPSTASLGDKKIMLPELRGDLISGRIASQKNQLPVSGQRLIFSIPGKNYTLAIVTTNEKGEFAFSLDKDYESDKAVLQVLGTNREEYYTELDPEPNLDFKDLEFWDFKLAEDMEKLIVERSIHNQIENAYFKIKPDTISIKKKQPFFHEEDVTIYHLDDYTRFSTFRETVVEVLENVWTTKRFGKPYLAIRSGNSTSSDVNYSSLVIVDGVVLQDFEQILDYDARKIKTVRIVTDKYVIGGRIFQGVIDIETFDNEYFNSRYPSYIKEVELAKPIVSKKYFRQHYTAGEDTIYDKIPDYRHQLLWLPNVELNSNTKNITFFTSDVSGEFEISLEGFTHNGTPVSQTRVIRVK